ncbi:L,D-transpeptidase family protein [Alteriqipengyuania sp. 357]
MKILKSLALLLATSSIMACGSPDDAAANKDAQAEESQTSAPEPEGYDDARSASRPEAKIEDGKVSLTLPEGITQDMLGERTAEMIAVQVMLDRSAHAPGVIDGRGGGNTDSAIRYYREAHGLGTGSKVDQALLQSLLDDQSGDIFRSYTVTETDAKGPFGNVPEGFAAMSKLDKLGYETPLEMLAERFHMDQDFLKALNPNADFGKAGTKLVIVSHGDSKVEGDIARIEVRKGDDRLVAFNDADEIVASYPATIGSAQFPSPSGTMEIVAVAPAPNYTFQSEGREWGPEGTYVLPPGPNNPVGGTWIDLAKDGYGIHGSPDPALIAKSGSHGCVRLTNWNAAALAQAIGSGITVRFV